jgi:integrase
MSGARETVQKRALQRRLHEGIESRHQRRCPSRDGGSCSCAPSFQAQVWSPRDRRPIRKTFATVSEAKAWRQETQVALRKGTLRVPSALTLAEAAERWLAAAETGVVRTRSGDCYKPSAVRSYKQVLEACVLPELGRQKLSAISSTTLQDLVDRLAARGLAPSTIRNTLLPLRAIYRRALNRGEVAINPTLKLALPAVRGRRERIAHPDEAAALIAALPLGERAVWAVALYAGLRLGELQALDWNHVDLDLNLLQVERSWDRVTGFIEPKSRSGRRRVPITSILRNHLLAHRLYQGKGGDGLVFPNYAGSGPFNPSTISRHAKAIWKAATLPAIGLHECRHTFASYMIAAGVNTKALSTYMGHASITITLDRYGHLLPGNENEAAERLDHWLTAMSHPDAI